MEEVIINPPKEIPELSTEKAPVYKKPVAKNELQNRQRREQLISLIQKIYGHRNVS